MYSTKKMYKEKNTALACFKTYINALYRSVLFTDGVISYIAQTQHFRESQFQKIKSKLKLSLRFDFQKVYLFKYVF